MNKSSSSLECIGPNNKRYSSLTLSPEEDDESAEESQVYYLLESRKKQIPTKEFSKEIRAKLDVEYFMRRPVILLDVQENNFEKIIHQILVKMLSVDPDLQNCIEVNQVKNDIFVSQNCTSTEHYEFSETLQEMTNHKDSISNPSWICITCRVATLKHRHLAIARLKDPVEQRSYGAVQLIMLILCPTSDKETKSGIETAKTFGTMLTFPDLRQQLLKAPTETEFLEHIRVRSQSLGSTKTEKYHIMSKMNGQEVDTQFTKQKVNKNFCRFGNGICDDLRRRLPHYISDYKDGIIGAPRTISKTISTTFFLYFAIILPNIAFGVLNDRTTHGIIDVRKVIVGQAIGGLAYAILSGQPLSIIMTTAPLCLYVKVVYALAEQFGVGFEVFFCLVGLWNSLFVALFALLDVSRIMKWCTRSTEEIFALFISVAFFVDVTKSIYNNFQLNYNSPICKGKLVQNISEALIPSNGTMEGTESKCYRENSLLFLLLILGTAWFGLQLYKFKNTLYLERVIRETVSDYALPIAVVSLSAIGSFLFQDIRLDSFNYKDSELFRLVNFDGVTLEAVLWSGALGLFLSLLMLMDQNISSAMINNPSNNLKKGAAYHWDLLVIAIINALLSLFTFPWMHAALPHCPLHMKSLADFEQRSHQGHIFQIIVRVRETRLTGIFSHILIGLSILLLPLPLAYIPIAVLNGLFLYIAITALDGNEFFDRTKLLLTEQVSFPPTSIIRQVPQRKIHTFTLLQVGQLMILCAFGFVPWPYVKMLFPLILLLLLPIRHRVVPLFIEKKYLRTIDGEDR